MVLFCTPIYILLYIYIYQIDRAYQLLLVYFLLIVSFRSSPMTARSNSSYKGASFNFIL